MTNYINKTFRKSKVVRLLFKKEDGRLQEFWRVPNNNEVDLGEYGLFILDTKKAIYSTNKNIPTYVLLQGKTEPININTRSQTFMPPTRYKQAINENITKKIIESTSGGMISKDTIIIVAVLIMGFVGMAYYLNGNQIAIIEALNNLGIGVG